jgi:hypothetical protein
MPSPRPQRNVSLRDFDKGGTWRPRRKTASGHPPRAKQLVELMTLGPPDGRPAMTLPDAAVAMGIKIGTARAYMHLPASRHLFMQLCTAIREGEIPANLRAAIEIRDSKKMAESAAGNRARIEAARYIERGGDKAGGVTVNVGVGIQTNITPGYRVVIPEAYAKASEQILKQARSTRNVIDGDVAEGVVVDESASPERGTPTADDVIDRDADQRPASSHGPEPFHLFQGPLPLSAKQDAPARAEPNRRRGGVDVVES